jgi:hypothetical protein
MWYGICASQLRPYTVFLKLIVIFTIVLFGIPSEHFNKK